MYANVGHLKVSYIHIHIQFVHYKAHCFHWKDQLVNAVWGNKWFIVRTVWHTEIHFVDKVQLLMLNLVVYILTTRL